MGERVKSYMCAHIAYAVHRKVVFMTLMINLATMFNEFDAIQQFASPVRVLYAPTDTITIEQYLLLQKSKLKLEFMPVPDMQDDRVSAGYLIGRLTAEACSTILITDSETLLNIGSIPAKGSASVYFAKDMKQVQKINKDLSPDGRKRVPRKVGTENKSKDTQTAKPKRQTVSVKQKSKSADNSMSGFLNLPEDCEETQDTLQEKKDLQTFLKSILGEKLATEQYSNIVRSTQKATEAIGWEILLRLEVKDKVVSDKIYELLAPKFAELKKIVN